MSFFINNFLIPSDKKEIINQPYRLRNAIICRFDLKKLQIVSYDKLLMFIEKVISFFWLMTFGQRSAKKVFKRKNPLILICRSKFVGNIGEESLAQNYFFDALEDINVDVDTFFCDSGRKLIGNQVCFYKMILENHYDYVFFYCYNSSNFSSPDLKILKKLRSKVSTNFFAIWEDTIGESFVNNIKYYSNFFDLNIINENPKFKDENNVLTYEERAKVFIPPSFIYPSPSYLKLSKAQNDRKIDVFFSGRVGAYRSYRRDSLLYLIENGVCGYINFFNAEGNLDIIEYYRMLWNSKIAINFSYSTKGHQLKGRATDAISLGAMLLESENHQIACYFEDGEDYVSFSSKEDLLEKIDYYLKNSEERIRIAENGMRKIEKCYNPKIYWNSILKKIDENIY